MAPHVRHARAHEWDTIWWLGREVVYDGQAWRVLEASLANGVRVLTFVSKLDDRTRLMFTLVQSNIWMAQGVISLPH